MQRREALKNVALVVGGGMLSGTTLSVILSGCTTSSKKGNKHSLSDEQQTIITELADVIIPATSCPGARAAGVGEFITMMIRDCYPEDVRKDFMKGLDDFSKSVNKEFHQDFVKLSAADKITAVTRLREHTLALQKADSKQAQKDKAANKEPKSPSHFFVIARELTILGYFTSETGATQALQYIAVPGRYDGCVDLKPGQKAWAT